MWIPVKLVIIASLIIGLLTTYGCERQQAVQPSGKTVRIGLIAPFSGPEEDWGPNALLGSKIARTLQPYLSNGDKVEVIFSDNSRDSQLTKVALKKLVETDKVAAILLLADSETTLAAIADADRYKTPIIALIASHPDVGDDNWVIQFVFDDIIQANIAALYVRDELFIEKAAVISDPEDPHFAVLAKEFSEKFKETGGKITSHTLTATTNLATLVESLKTAGLTFAYLPLSAEKIMQLEQVAREADWNPQMMVSDGVLSTIRLQYEDDLDLLEGMLATDIYSTIPPKSTYGKAVFKTYLATENDKKATFAALSCEATSMVLQAMDRCHDSSDRKCINNMLRQTGEFTGIFDTITINKDGKTERPVYINTINNHQLKFLLKVY